MNSIMTLSKAIEQCKLRYLQEEEEGLKKNVT
jgi:hypothetical protein